MLLVTLFSASAIAQEVPISADESAHAWLVELSNAPTIEGTSLSTVRNEKNAFRAAARQAGIRFSERFAFDTLFNGVSINADRGQVAALQRIAGVKAIWPVVSVSVPPAAAISEPDLISALSMTGADVAHSSLGLTGKGIKVAIVDTGIDYNHPDLGGCFGPGCRVAVGYDFVGDAYDSSSPDPAAQVPHPDNDPMDCAGHGTHVTGIVGASGVVTGVAPGVTFGAYRVFGCTGTTESDVMIAAMERALADGMQVLNMSIGSSFTWPQYPTAVAANRLVNHGVVVVASIGNSGANGLYSGGAPGVGEKVIGVASFDNTFINGLNSFTVSTDAGRLFGYFNGSGSPIAPLSGSAPLSRTGTKASGADACNPLPAGSLNGTVALVRRGTCGFAVKVANAQAAGAAGVVLYNNQNTGLLTPAVTPPTPTIPVVFITQADGNFLDDRLAAGAVTLSWTDQLTSSANTLTAGLISSFSSYGMAPDLSLKPDIGAPGGFIRSTYPLALGGYANLSGTSMSSPHVAGAAALFLEAHPRTNAQDVRGFLQNSASPKAWFGNPGLGFLDNVHRQGAGMLRIDRAVLATTAATPGKLSLGESQAGPATRTITLTNSGSSDVVFTPSFTPALATGPNTFTPSFFVGNADVQFSAASVAVPAGGSATVSATIAAPPSAALGDRSLYGGYLVFTPDDGSQTLRVPFAGFKGDYQSIQVLAPTANGFPWLARAVGASFVKESAGATFDLAAGDFPTVLAHLDHQSRIFQMEVFDAVTGRAWHRAFRDDYEVRNSTATGFFALAWDGTTGIGAKNGFKTVTVPAGQYVLKLSVLKALGDENNPADWETWTSPAFNITR
ncbi:MAG TPA: S8 family serine peptidase [Myxococcales bacterium]|nr:S8 family serine peptidase [Myxococcales bacterium]